MHLFLHVEQEFLLGGDGTGGGEHVAAEAGENALGISGDVGEGVIQIEKISPLFALVEHTTHPHSVYTPYPLPAQVLTHGVYTPCSTPTLIFYSRRLYAIKKPPALRVRGGKVGKGRVVGRNDGSAFAEATA